VAGMAGYFGFVAFVGSDRGAAAGVLVLAAGTGFAAFFSPCSFPLLLTFLSGRSQETKGTALWSALRVAGGATFLLAMVALVVAEGGSALARVVEFDSPTGRGFRLSVGLVLIVFGLRQANLLQVRMRWFDQVARASSRPLDPAKASSQAGRDLVYGFGYLLAGFG
jgi:cytochrome c biogenesis protein CcdA